MIPYNSSFDPPAPLLQVEVAGLVNAEPSEMLPTLLDTGSDVTAVPTRLANSLDLRPIGRLQLEGFEAATTLVTTYGAQLTVASMTFSPLEVILTGLDFVVLGRDVLNRFYLLLNGPELTFDLNTTAFTAGT